MVHCYEEAEGDQLQTRNVLGNRVTVFRQRLRQELEGVEFSLVDTKTQNGWL